jgi:hypothetical protein
MTGNFQRQTAKIYKFPIMARTVPGTRREPDDSAFDLSNRFSDAAFGGSWYHEAAIKDAEGNRKQ